MSEQRLMKVRLGVPKLGIIEEVYDFNDSSSRETLDKNVALGHMILSMEEIDE